MIRKFDSDSDKKRILIVDDQDMNVVILSRKLESEGYAVCGASDGKEALELVLSDSQPLPHIILMDLMMPKMDGWETITRIREEDKTKHIPIIAISALDEAGYNPEKCGFDQFMNKPIDFQELKKKLKELM